MIDPQPISPNEPISVRGSPDSKAFIHSRQQQLDVGIRAVHRGDFGRADSDHLPPGINRGSLLDPSDVSDAGGEHEHARASPRDPEETCESAPQLPVTAAKVRSAEPAPDATTSELRSAALAGTTKSLTLIPAASTILLNASAHATDDASGPCKLAIVFTSPIAFTSRAICTYSWLLPM